MAYPMHDPTAAGVPASPDLPAVERRVLDHWAADKTFEASRRGRARPAPTARTSTSSTTARRSPTACRTTATCFTGYVKDVVPRYQTMRGRRVERRFGWDCHGLPAEVEAEKQLGITTKARDPRRWAWPGSTRPAAPRCWRTPRTGSGTSPGRPAGSTSPTTTRPSTWTTWKASCGRSRPCTTRAWSTRASGCWRTAGAARRRCPTPRPGWTTSTGTGRTRRSRSWFRRCEHRAGRRQVARRLDHHAVDAAVEPGARRRPGHRVRGAGAATAQRYVRRRGAAGRVRQGAGGLRRRSARCTARDLVGRRYTPLFDFLVEQAGANAYQVLGARLRHHRGRHRRRAPGAGLR